MKLTLDKKFKSKLKGRYGQYKFEVGILQDAPHKLPKRGERGKKGKDVISVYAGGPVRKKSRIDSGEMVSQVSKSFRKHLGFNYLSEPFKKKNADINKFTKEFFRLCTGRSQKKRCENLLQAIVRNPLLRGDYGRNSKLTESIKGFNRLGFDTAQLFKSIIARATKRGFFG